MRRKALDGFHVRVPPLVERHLLQARLGQLQVELRPRLCVCIVSSIRNACYSSRCACASGGPREELSTRRFEVQLQGLFLLAEEVPA